METMSGLHLMNNSDDQRNEVKVGDPATILAYSYSYAATVIAVSKSGRTITVQQDHAEQLIAGDLMGEIQTYDYCRNPNGTVWTFRWTKLGWYFNGYRCFTGTRREWRDTTF